MNKIIQSLANLPSGTIVQMPEKEFDEVFNKDSDGRILVERTRLKNGIKVCRDP